MLKRGLAMKLQTKDDRIEQILEAAAVVHWADFIGGRPNGSVHIEYGFAPEGTLDYLQFWSSIKRGYWLLACSYCRHPTLMARESGSITDLNPNPWRTFWKL